MKNLCSHNNTPDEPRSTSSFLTGMGRIHSTGWCRVQGSFEASRKKSTYSHVIPVLKYNIAKIKDERMKKIQISSAKVHTDDSQPSSSPDPRPQTPDSRLQTPDPRTPEPQNPSFPPKKKKKNICRRATTTKNKKGKKGIIVRPLTFSLFFKKKEKRKKKK